VKNRSVLGM